MLRESGFFDEEPVALRDGTEVRPLDLTAHLLFRQWQLGEGEEEFTVMRVEVEGVDSEGPVLHRYDLIDRYDAETGVSSMARTTGYTCTAAVRLVADGSYREPGVSPPENIGRREGCFESILAHLEQRGVVYRHRIERPDR